ncbi:hypothetical protein BDZ89DRAFT_1085919 [Hymenopellis radicata]|nr:hypothetical protein BDZ89DRAFT_1085919 [Hymenopellis radicata]
MASNDASPTLFRLGICSHTTWQQVAGLKYPRTDTRICGGGKQYKVLYANNDHTEV